MMTRASSPSVPVTAIEPCPTVAPTAITADGGVRPPAGGQDTLDLASIVLAEGKTARRAGRWWSAFNYLNLAVCLWAFFLIIELVVPAPWPFLEMAIGIWFFLDFMPVALVFAGAQRLKRLKSLGMAWAGAVAMIYLAMQRAVLAWCLALIASHLGVPAVTLLAGGLTLALLNGLAAWLVMRFLLRPELRQAFR